MAFPAPDAIDHRLLLIGDAGDADRAGEPGLDVLAHQVALLPDRTTVVFLGDNVYETGMPEPSPVLEGTPVEEILDETLLNLYESRRDAERRVKAQVHAVEVPGARAVFIPGNHDWDQFGLGGWKRVRELERYLHELEPVAKVPVSLLPGGGCPGPVALDLGRRGRLVVLDTQWWLERGEKPAPDDNPTGCAHPTEAGVTDALSAELRRAAADHRTVVVAGHHPLRSRGPHGGWVDPRVHLFPMTMAGSYVPVFVRWLPLPLLGSLAAWVRAEHSPSAQDMSSATNTHMRRALEAALETAAEDGARPIAYAAGHDHGLQVFRGGTAVPYVLVSGLGSHEKVSAVGHDSHTLFAHADGAHPGLMKIDFLRDGRVRLGVVEWSAETPWGVELYSRMLEPRGR